MKKKNIINFSEICEAMEDNSPEFRHYLDLQTGEVIIDSDYYGEPDREKLFNKIEQNSERYNLIPTISSYEGYQDMENFIYTVGNEKLQNELSRVIQGRGAFRRFKDVLSQNPEEQIRWCDFKNKIIQQKAKEWLEGLGMKVREKDTKDNWVEERIQKKKKLIDDTINMFVE